MKVINSTRGWDFKPGSFDLLRPSYVSSPPFLIGFFLHLLFVVFYVFHKISSPFTLKKSNLFVLDWLQLADSSSGYVTVLKFHNILKSVNCRASNVLCLSKKWYNRPVGNCIILNEMTKILFDRLIVGKRADDCEPLTQFGQSVGREKKSVVSLSIRNLD